MKIAGVVVLFFPSFDVVKNIKSYYKYLDKLFVIDNTPEYSTDLFKCFENIEYLHSKSNIGIAKAYNLALKKAKKEGYKYLFTIDQDSYFEDGMFKMYLKCILNNKEKNVAIYSLNHTKKENINCSYKTNKIVMSSGNILDVDKILDLRGFDENLFIDEVDHEICMRAILNGYKTIEFENVFLNHNLGKKFLKKNKKIRLYSSKRLYYIIRNYLYVRKKYKNCFNDFFKKRDKFIIKFLFNNIRYKKNKIKTLFFILRGIFDYYINKTGKKVKI